MEPKETCILESTSFEAYYFNGLHKLELVLTKKPDEDSFTKAIDAPSAESQSSKQASPAQASAAQESGKPAHEPAVHFSERVPTETKDSALTQMTALSAAVDAAEVLPETHENAKNQPTHSKLMQRLNASRSKPSQVASLDGKAADGRSTSV